MDGEEGGSKQRRSAALLPVICLSVSVTRWFLPIASILLPSPCFLRCRSVLWQALPVSILHHSAHHPDLCICHSTLFPAFFFLHTHFPLLTVCSTPLSIRNGSGGEAAHEISGDIQIEVMPKAIRLCLIDEILPKYMDRQTCKTDVPSISSTKT